jgi:hypothetical protein
MTWLYGIGRKVSSPEEAGVRKFDPHNAMALLMRSGILVTKVR